MEGCGAQIQIKMDFISSAVYSKWVCQRFLSFVQKLVKKEIHYVCIFLYVLYNFRHAQKFMLHIDGVRNQSSTDASMYSGAVLYLTAL